MTTQFPVFAQLVNESFQKLVKGQVFEVSLTGDELFAAYLAAFPEGTNEIFKKRTEHDCSCCKQFIRRAGIITDGERTVWDEAAVSAPHPYNVVAMKLRGLILTSAIKDLYVVSKKEASFGAKKSVSTTPELATTTWNHLFTDTIPMSVRSDLPDTKKGEHRTAAQVFERGLKELSPEAVNTVLGLIEANNLYRGDEHKPAIQHFIKAQKEYKEAEDEKLYCWKNASSAASRFRNSVIGTLVVELSEGKDVDHAVRSFEAKVAPQNYKRTTAVITPGMINKAMETIKELELEPALERRFARIDDVNVNDVKWVDNRVKPLMKGGIADMLMAESKTAAVDPKDAEKISVDEFMKLLPAATAIEMLFEGRHQGNLVSLTAPIHPEPKQLFKWDNDFAWSYSGNVADSIKERVKKAGGNVVGVMRVSLSWYNHDDLDLHIHEPSGKGRGSAGGEISFRCRRGWTEGELDVDMNAGMGRTREPVENIAWQKSPPPGKYKVVVNQYYSRESSGVGFVVEVESNGKVHNFSYNKAVRQGQNIHVCTLVVANGMIENIEPGDDAVTSASVSQDRWGMKTEKFVKVNAITHSPNYWGSNKVGNKHLFFFLDGAKSDEPTRGIYNEFLHSRLEVHRKVFEVIGDKTKCQPTEGQLSGLGFSSTKKDSFIVKLSQGKRQRLLEVENV